MIKLSKHVIYTIELSNQILTMELDGLVSINVYIKKKQNMGIYWTC